MPFFYWVFYKRQSQLLKELYIKFFAFTSLLLSKISYLSKSLFTVYYFILPVFNLFATCRVLLKLINLFLLWFSFVYIFIIYIRRKIASKFCLNNYHLNNLIFLNQNQIILIFIFNHQKSIFGYLCLFIYQSINYLIIIYIRFFIYLFL